MKLSSIVNVFCASMIIISLGLPENSWAFSWQDLWLTKDQQGTDLLTQGKALDAATTFNDPQWRGVAYYRAGQYTNAAKFFAQNNNLEAQFNQGNALAQSGQYQAAIDAYEKVLQQNPKHADAIYNRDLLKKLLQQQESQPQNQNQNQNQNQKNSTPDEKQSQQTSNSQNDKTDPQSAQNQANAKPNQQPSENPNPESTPAAQTPKSSPNTTTKNSDQQLTQQASPSNDDTSQKLLQQLPDDPGGLLKHKFLRDYQHRHAKEFFGQE